MVLDNVTAEVTKKVKSAIKAKLTEIGAYVDDELPDYIMILVGNKKTKDQMDDDLSLFLGHNTERFTSWLHNVLQKLNAASLFQKEAKPVKEKEKKKEEEKEKAEVVEAPKTAATVSVVEEKKKHKKKKDKSEKKKEKKEKKKKKDKDKEKHAKSQKHKEKDRSKSKSKSPTGEEGAVASTTKEAVVTRPSSSTALLLKTQKPLVAESEILAGAATKSTSEDPEAVVLTREEEDVPDDVVNLRPNEEDLALGLEEDLPVKRQNRSLAKEIKELSAAIQPSQLLQNIEVKVDSSGAKEVATKPIIDVSEPEVTTTGNVAVAGASSSISGVSVHDRLGAPTSSVPPLSSTKRIINLREESSFPPKPSLVASGEGIGRVVSSAIASAVKSVAVTAPSKGIADGKTAKKLEARVRPLFNSRRADVVVEEVPEEAVAPSRVVSTVGAVLKRSHSPEDPDESEEPLTKRVGVVSKIEVTPRPRRPGSMQANTALILRAVADAHKSVNKPSRKAVDEKEEEKPNKKELFTRSYHERQNQRLSNTSEGKNVKKFAITVPNALLKDNVEMQIGGKSALGEAHFEGIEMEEEYGPEEAMDASIADTKISQDKILSQPKPSATGRVLPMQVDDPAGSTRFIVTLDGLANEAGSTTDLRSRLSGRPVRTPSVDEEEYIEEVEEWEEVEEMEGVTPQGGIGQERVSSAGGTAGGAFAPKWKSKIDATGLVAKKEERCRFWPACKEGAACPYIHPSKLCNTFPNCRFGDKCIYIHPNCKFDGSCAKPNCPYTHAGTRTFAAPVKAKFPAVRTKIKCRYYPKCVDMTCPYMHPKQICRYGKSCQTPSCIFVHPDVTTGALLKWTAPKQTPGNGESLEGSLPTSALAASSSVSTTTPSLASLSKTTSASLTAV